MFGGKRYRNKCQEFCFVQAILQVLTWRLCADIEYAVRYKNLEYSYIPKFRGGNTDLKLMVILNVFLIKKNKTEV